MLDRGVRGWVVLCIVTLLGCQADAPKQRGSSTTLTVFAAASLTDVLEDVVAAFETANPSVDVQLNVAGTSLLARQIDQGAPADVFFSANEDWMRWLEEQGHVSLHSVLPFTNELVVVAPPNAVVLNEIAELPSLTTISVADPSHVPSGIYARQALECVGIWEALQNQLVPTLDVRAALMAVRSGAAEAALVYVTDAAIDREVEVVIRIPAPCQPDIQYATGVIKHSQRALLATQFITFASETTQEARWERYGFMIRTTAPNTPNDTASRSIFP